MPCPTPQKPVPIRQSKMTEAQKIVEARWYVDRLIEIRESKKK